MESLASAAVNGVTLASGQGDLVELLVRFLLLRSLPEWLQWTIFCLVVATVISLWAVRRARVISARGAAAAGPEG